MEIATEGVMVDFKDAMDAMEADEHVDMGEALDSAMFDLFPPADDINQGLPSLPAEDNDTAESLRDEKVAALDEAETMVEARLRPIEVLVTPPTDPESYEQVELEWIVERVVDKIEVGEDYIFTVEFADGSRDQLTHNDLSQLRRGPGALKRYEDQQATHDQVTMVKTKRGRSVDDYGDTESDPEYEDKPHLYKRRKRVAQPSRRSARQASQQASRQASLDDSEADLASDDGLDGNQQDGLEDEVRSSKLNGHISTTSLLEPRKTRSHHKARPRPEQSDDELAGDHDMEEDSFDDDNFIPVVRSDIRGLKSKASGSKKRRPKQPLYTSRPYDSDSSIEFEARRGARRTNRYSKSMREPGLDDEVEAIEEKSISAPKHVSVKEVFEQLPPDHPFVGVHCDVCDTCGGQEINGKGPLIYCQGCSNSYHKICIGPRAQRDHRITKIGTNDFVLQCRFCIGHYGKKDQRAPDHAMCQACKLKGGSCAEFSPKKTPKQEEKIRLENGGEDPITQVDPDLINHADQVLFRCSTCRRAYHVEHLPPMTTQPVDPQDVKADRLEEYSLVDWKCKDCVNAKQKLHALVAWRPVDQEAYTQGQTCNDFGEDDIQYLVKWERRSHFHDHWMPGAWVFGVAAGAMRSSFHKRDAAMEPKMTFESAVEEEWLLADVFLRVKYRTRDGARTKAEDLARIDDISSVFVKFQGLSYEETVWDDPPSRDSGAPWQAFCDAYDEYLNGKYFPSVPDSQIRERLVEYRDLDFGKHCWLSTQPPMLKRGQLMEYQLQGVNFLLLNFHQQRNVILADEMGLGKTIQIIAFLATLVLDQPNCWPFLIVVPNSTCPNWRRELKQWAPDLRVVTYHGGKAAQDLAWRHELFPDDMKGGMKAHVVIMSYEAAVNLKVQFSRVKWVGLIVDEGQKLKNENTLLYKALQDMKIPCRILLTGTPLQNNKRELFNLLQFIDPNQNAEKLDEEYAELTKENIPKLHDTIRPYFLRRTKAEVLKFLPPMGQIIVPITMTDLQQRLSKSIMARNPDLIRSLVTQQQIKTKERRNLTNIWADLRQCLCHPFCFSSTVEDKNLDYEQMHRSLVEASPKLMLFEIMLPKLKERGHRVLIFSQFLHCLTIIEDFLTGMGLEHSRIDGTISALEKQKRIDAFNAPNSPLFAMLLSTRAGGVGINLATADTVIIYDPDFNPHQDIQALSRAHRIGQKKKVLCFQLMTKGTIEETTMERGRKKMALDHALIESLDASQDDGEDLESLLRQAAVKLFSDQSEDAITYDSASVEKLLDRSQVEDTNTGDDHSAESQFSFARVWANNEGKFRDNLGDSAEPTPPPASVWEKILSERQKEHERSLAANQQTYGRGARRRGTNGISYKTQVGFIEGVDNDNVLTVAKPNHADSGGSDTEDELYIDGNDNEDEDEESEGFAEDGAAAQNKGNKGKTQSRPPLEQVPALAEPNQVKVQDGLQISPRKPSNNTQKDKTVRNGMPPTHNTNNGPQINQPQIPGSLALTASLRPSHEFPQAQHMMPVPPQQLPSSSNLAVHISSTPRFAGQPQFYTPPGILSHHPRNGLAWSDPTQPLHKQRPPLPQNGVWIGGNPCVLCGGDHTGAKACVDLGKETDLRVAIDELKRTNDPSTIPVREYLAARLRYLKASRNSQTQ